MSSSYTAMKKEETYALIKKAKIGDEEAREKLVSFNTGLVKSLALKYAGSGYELEDLIQIGFMGLLKSIDRFDVRYDVMFSTYAVPMILGEIKRYIRDDGKIKVSRQMKMDIKRMKQIKEELYHKSGTSPKLSELAQAMEVSVEMLLEIMEAEEALCNFESIDDPDSVKQYSAEGKSGYGASEENLVDIICLKSMIGKLEEKERKIIVLRYFKDMTQQQIANLLGISQVQVSRIEKRVLENLRVVCSG